MSTTLVQSIQKKLGHNSMDKIDPNVQHQSETLHPGKTDHFTQAAASAVLAGIYKFGRTREGANAILNGSYSNWLSAIFLGQEGEVVQKVSSYSGNTIDESRSLMTTIAAESVECIRQSVGKDADEKTVKAYLVAQRHDILAYLPAELQMGQILNDGSMDDRTNKMEGPISSFIHAMGASFSQNSDERKEDKDWD